MNKGSHLLYETQACNYMLPNFGGSINFRRILLANVVRSIVLYGSLTWLKDIGSMFKTNDDSTIITHCKKGKIVGIYLSKR